MHQFTTWTGTTVPLMNDNIDTDQLLPKQFLKLIDKRALASICYMLGGTWMITTRTILISFSISLSIKALVSSYLGITSEQVLLGNTLLGLWQIMASRSSLQAPLGIFITTMT